MKLKCKIWIKDMDDVLMELIAMAFRVGEECQ